MDPGEPDPEAGQWSPTCHCGRAMVAERLPSHFLKCIMKDEKIVMNSMKNSTLTSVWLCQHCETDRLQVLATLTPKESSSGVSSTDPPRTDRQTRYAFVLGKKLGLSRSEILSHLAEHPTVGQASLLLDQWIELTEGIQG